jgi:uncharacterized protein involved in exopolysaccharide biosynthesis
MRKNASVMAVFFSWRRLIYRVTGTAAVVAVIVSLLLPNWYGASALIMPPEEGESRGGLLGMFTQIGMDFGGSGLLSTTPATDLSIGILKSRLLRGKIVDRFDLVSVYRAKTREHAIEDLWDHIRFDTTPEGLVEIWVEDRDATRAADMANAFAGYLDEHSRFVSVRSAGRTREFIESAIVDVRTRLEEAAEDLRAFQKANTAIELSEQTRVTVQAVAELESERGRLEIEKRVLETFSMPSLPRIREIETRLNAIDQALGELCGGVPDAGSDPASGVFLPVGEIPSLVLRYADLSREVMVHEKVYEFLRAQLEDARIQESRDLQVVMILDEAVPPIKKTRPRRSIVCILTTLLALAASLGVALAAESFLDFSENAESPTMVTDSKESQILLRLVKRLASWGRQDTAEGTGLSPESL